MRAGQEANTGGARGKEPSASAGDLRDLGQSLSQEDPLKAGAATHSGILAWRIPWTEELGTLHRATKSPATACMHRALRTMNFVLHSRATGNLWQFVRRKVMTTNLYFNNAAWV